MDKKILKYSPLTEATFYILISLNKPLHGYGIIKKVERLTNNRLKLAAGTLYGAINTLSDNKLITLVSENQDSKRKKMYEITTSGKKLLYYEITRLREMVNNGIEEVGDYYE
ncbi:MAG: helix-turn-helix transcriptional regulator [Candidatus Izimaplasma sp.]|nr:helix-turn-helix transcriptional regulator [Candidatus Izimaplasma bacterium]